jgi:hypothetical protein
MKKTTCCLLLVLSVSCFLLAKEPSSLQGESLLATNVLDSFKLGNANVPDATMEKIEVEGQPFKEALRLTISESNEAKPWNAQIRSYINAPITKGDVVQLAFKMRTIKAPEKNKGVGKVGVLLEKKNDDKYLTVIPFNDVTAGSKWKQFTIYVRAEAKDVSEPGTAWLNIRFNYQKQVVELADIRLVNLGPLKRIPSTPGPLLPEKVLASFALGNAKVPDATMEKVSVEGQEFKEALRLSLPDYTGGDPWNAQVVSRIIKPIAEGDGIKLTFWMRTIEAPEEDSQKGKITQTDRF